jgi:copper chaperone
MSEIPAEDQPETVRQTFAATGLTCGHCANAVVDELSAIDDVMSAGVEVVKGGESTITVEALRAISADEVAEALAEAGDYHLA